MPTFRKTPRRRKSMVREGLGRRLAVWEDLGDDCASRLLRGELVLVLGSRFRAVCTQLPRAAPLRRGGRASGGQSSSRPSFPAGALTPGSGSADDVDVDGGS